MITHKLSTSIYLINGSSNLLMKELALQHSDNTHFNTFSIASNNFSEIISNIIYYVQRNKKNIIIAHSKCNLYNIINNTLEKQKASIKQNNNIISLVYDKEIPKTIISDSERLSLIFSNLISNANKFTTKGSIIINLKLISKTVNTCKLFFKIKDNGIGISEDKQKHILKSFRASSHEMTGLGLTVAQQLLDNLDASLKIKSKENKGASFSFTINCKYQETALVAIKNTKNSIKFNKSTIKSILANKKILVVEDNRVNQLITVKTLNKVNIKCETAENGLIAVNMFKDKTKDYDLILMDIHMPVMDGFEATLKIKELNPSIPIIALTSLKIDKTPINLKTLELDYVLNKPFVVDTLYNKIALHLYKNSQTSVL